MSVCTLSTLETWLVTFTQTLAPPHNMAWSLHPHPLHPRPPPIPVPISQAAKEALAAAQALLETATVKVVHYRARCEGGGEDRWEGWVISFASSGRAMSPFRCRHQQILPALGWNALAAGALPGL